MSWEETSLGNHIDLITGPAFKSKFFTEDPSDIPLVKGENLSQGHILWGKSRYWPKNKLNGYERYSLESGDVVLAMDRPWVTAGLKYACIGNRDPEALLVQRVARLRGTEQLTTDFLRYIVASKEFCGYIKNIMGGTNVPHISGDQIRAFKITLPPIKTQKRIADILSAYDDLIENNRRRIALLEQAARELYREWFVRLKFPGHKQSKIIDGLPKGWERKALGQLVDLRKDTAKPEDFTGEENYIGLEHIPRRSFTLGEWGVSEGLESNKYKFQSDDILFGKIRPYFHKVGFALVDGLTSSDALVWRVNAREDWPLVVCATSSDHFISVASKTVREGSKMPRADWGVLENYEILVPEVELRDLFNEVIFGMTSQCKALVLSIRNLAQARDLLLPRLMSGKISV